MKNDKQSQVSKQGLLARAVETHIDRLQASVNYGLGSQPDNEVEYRLNGNKWELLAYKALKRGNTSLAKRHMVMAERWYTIASGV